MTSPLTGWDIAGLILLLVAIAIGVHAGDLRDWWHRVTRDQATPLLTAREEQKLRQAIRHAGDMPELGMTAGQAWDGECPDCVWWHPAPSEAEDAIAVYRPCAVHDPALWAEFERKYAQ